MPRSLFAFAILVSGCTATQGAAPELSVATTPPSLEAMWITEGFANPEGVAVGVDGNYYISNISGAGRDKDGVGWISRLAPSGDVLVTKWAEGFDAPKGMAVLDGKLYVADIDRIHVLSTETGDRLDVIDAPGATFLNDATTWNGAVYVSDSGGAHIYKIVSGDAEVWLEDPVLEGINGLLGDADRLLVSTMDEGALLEISSAGDVTTLAIGMFKADGIGIAPDGTYLVSSWPGQIFHVDATGSVTELLTTEVAEIYQNDLTVIGDMVIVPNWQPGTVTAWRIVP